MTRCIWNSLLPSLDSFARGCHLESSLLCTHSSSLCCCPQTWMQDFGGGLKRQQAEGENPLSRPAGYVSLKSLVFTSKSWDPCLQDVEVQWGHDNCNALLLIQILMELLKFQGKQLHGSSFFQAYLLTERALPFYFVLLTTWGWTGRWMPFFSTALHSGLETSFWVVTDSGSTII